MKSPLYSSSEFASLVEQLLLDPDNPVLKLALLKQLPRMKALAEIHPLNLFRLAQLYMPASAQYKAMMTESAERGCTNAMLALCELVLKSGRKEQFSLVTHYLRKIEASEDSYIIEKSKKLVTGYPEYKSQDIIATQSAAGLKAIGFFKLNDPKSSNEQAGLINKNPSKPNT